MNDLKKSALENWKEIKRRERTKKAQSETFSSKNWEREK